MTRQRIADLEKRRTDPTTKLPKGRLRAVPKPLPGLAAVARKYRRKLSLAVDVPELARASGLTYALVHSILTGRRSSPSFRAGMRMALALGLTPYELLRILHPSEPTNAA